MKILRCFILTLCLLLCFQRAFAAITSSSFGDLGNNGGSTNTLTGNATVNSGDTFLGVCLQGDGGGGTDDITSVVYNTTGTMTLIQKQVGAGTRLSYAYGLQAPATGTHPIVMTAGSAHFLLAGYVTYKGTLTTGQPEASNTGQSSSGPSYLTSLTTLSNNAWVVMCAGSNQTIASTNCTSRISSGTGSPPSYMICDSNSAITPAGSFSMTSCTAVGCAGSSFVGNHIMFALAPATVAATVVKRHSGGVF